VSQRRCEMGAIVHGKVPRKVPKWSPKVPRRIVDILGRGRGLEDGLEALMHFYIVYALCTWCHSESME
jgi:hypothetical protein